MHSYAASGDLGNSCLQCESNAIMKMDHTHHTWNFWNKVIGGVRLSHTLVRTILAVIWFLRRDYALHQYQRCLAIH